MKPRFGMSLNPSWYAEELVSRLGFKEPSLSWVNMVLQHLGLETKYYPGEAFFHYVEDPEIAQNSSEQVKLLDVESDHSAPIFRKKQKRPIEAALKDKTIWIDSDFPVERQRLSTFHEVGHSYLPWHKDLSYFKDGCFVDPQDKLLYEQEANRFAADLLMPRTFFMANMDSLPYSIQSIEMLSAKYLTSLEATAWQYMDLCLNSCALVIVEALPDVPITQNHSRYKVRYHKRSRSFKHFIQPGTEIAADSPIAQASISRSKLICEVPGWVLGLTPEKRFILHCRPWGKEGDVLVLVEEPQGNQGRFF